MRTALLARLWTDQTKWWTTLPSRDWETLLAQARRSGLHGRLARHLLDRGALAETPRGPRHHLESALRLAERQRNEVLWEIDCIQRALAKVGTPIVLLKGAAYQVADLPPGPGRLFSDIDILVDHGRISAVESALFESGWISLERGAYNDRYYRRWMHELPPMRHIHRGTNIDVHHTISPPTSRFHVDGEQLLALAQAVTGYPGLFVLAPADMVLHSATHLFLEGEFSHGLRDLLDLNDLLTHFGQRTSFWPELLDRTDELQLQVPLCHALIGVANLFATSAPSEFSERANALDNGRLQRRLMTKLLNVAIQPEHPSCDSPLSGLVRWLLYVRSHWLRMRPHLLVYHLARKMMMRLKAGSQNRTP